MREFGGIDAFLGVWRGCLREDIGRGGFAAFRHFDCVIRLAQYCEQTRPNYDTMSDEQIEDAIAAYESL